MLPEMGTEERVHIPSMEEENHLQRGYGFSLEGTDLLCCLPIVDCYCQIEFSQFRISSIQLSTFI